MPNPIPLPIDTAIRAAEARLMEALWLAAEDDSARSAADAAEADLADLRRALARGERYDVAF